MQTLKIMIVHETLGRLAGAEQNIFVTAPYLAKQFELEFLFNTRSGREEEAFCAPFKRTHQVDFNGEEDVTKPEVEQILADSKPDLVYVHKCISIPVLQALVNSRIPLIRMEHDHDMYCMRKYKYNPLTRRICTKKACGCCIFPCGAILQRVRKDGKSKIEIASYSKHMRMLELNRQFTAYFAVTNYMKEELIRQGFDADHIHVFPPVPAPRKTETKSSFSDENLILYAGQIIRGKGVDCLLRAVARIQTPFKLIILGDGSHLDTCKRLASDLDLNDRVTFAGYVQPDKLKTYYSTATLVAVPSVWPEPIATIGLEVARHGLPVVGFDAGGIRDWLKDEHTGYLVPWKNIPVMAEKIDHLLTHKNEARRMGENARHFVDTHYNFDSYITRMIETFSTLAAASRVKTTP